MLLEKEQSLHEPSEQVATESEQTLLDTTNSEAEKSGPSIEELAQILASEGRKLVSFTPPLSSENIYLLEDTFSKLEDLSHEITQIKGTVIKQNDTIKERVLKLQAHKELGLQSNFGQSDSSIQHYTGLLDQILQEVVYEKQNIAQYRLLETPTMIPVADTEADTFDGFIRNKTNQVKKQIKKIHKDLNISASRYNFTFENQMKRLDHLSAMVAYQNAVMAAQQKNLAQETTQAQTAE